MDRTRFFLALQIMSCLSAEKAGSNLCAHMQFAQIGAVLLLLFTKVTCKRAVHRVYPAAPRKCKVRGSQRMKQQRAGSQSLQGFRSPPGFASNHQKTVPGFLLQHEEWPYFFVGGCGVFFGCFCCCLRSSVVFSRGCFKIFYR